MKYTPVIGIEIHVELKTRTKMFSSAPCAFGKRANSLTLPFDLSFPGTLPLINKEAVRKGIQVCHALHMEIDSLLRFDRKNYYYPDLPKGYQITQQFHPMGKGGYVCFKVEGKEVKIELDNAHLEEDTAKQIHEGKKTYLDFNRCGIPLLEIVSKPVMHSPIEAMLYVSKIKEIVTFLEVCDGKMENGSLRCDINISLMDETGVLGTKTEIKNLNTIENISLALQDEIARQEQILLSHGTVKEETRRYSEKEKRTILMREKKGEMDYEYFPEANLPPVKLSKSFIHKAIQESPLLVEDYLRLWSNLSLSDYQKQMLLKDIDLTKYFQSCLSLKLENPSLLCNLLISDILSYLKKKGLSFSKPNLKQGEFVALCNHQSQNKLQSNQVKEILKRHYEEGKDILKEISLLQQNPSFDEEKLTSLIQEMLEENQSAIEEYRKGKEKVFSYLVGQVLKKTRGSVSPSKIQTILFEILSKTN